MHRDLQPVDRPQRFVPRAGSTLVKTNELSKFHGLCIEYLNPSPFKIEGVGITQRNASCFK